jgi:tetratricopeptide (TPR) repeat protein
VALGLQLTFWQNATSAPDEMLELLLFAAAVWCLLEFRADSRLAWLDWAAFICGIALANSWAMAGYLPLLAMAFIWSKRLRFFNVRFLQHVETSAWRRAIPSLASDCRFFLRMALFALAGLCLMLLLPLLNGLSPDSPLRFGQALHLVASSYKALWVALAKVFRYHKEVSLVLMATSLLPVLVLSLEWRGLPVGGRKSRLDIMAVTFNAAHLFLLLLCLAIAFDPLFSPRQLSPRLGIIGITLTFLPLYYLNALAIGYYTDFFLRLSSRYAHRHRLWVRALHWTAPKFAYAVLGIMLVGLLSKNLPTIRLAHGRQLERYAGFVVDSLPPQGAVVCSYDAALLTLLQGGLDQKRKADRYVVVDMNGLPDKRYRAWLKRKSPKWTEPPAPAKRVAAAGLATPTPPEGAPDLFSLLAWLTQSNQVCFLEPKYGPLAEQFYFQPRGLVYELKPYTSDPFNGPPLTPVELTNSSTLWQRVIETGVDPVNEALHDAEQRRGLRASLLNHAHLVQPLPDVVKGLARWYSGAINGWGVLLQRQGQPRAATPCFAKALELNPDNLPARLNWQCNSNLLARNDLALAAPEDLQAQLEKYRNNWAQVLGTDGPIDDPTYCYWLGIVCARQDLRRQAGQHLERALVLAPKELYPRVDLARLNISCGMPDRALAVLANARTIPQPRGLDQQTKVDLDFLEAEAWLAKTNMTKAEHVLLALLDSNPTDSAVRNRVKSVFVAVGNYTNALRMTDQELQLSPTNLQALVEKGLLCMRLGAFSNAIPLLTRALEVTNSYPLWLYRAQAHMETGQWSAATNDYYAALHEAPLASEPYYGLAAVALRQGQTNSARQYRLLALSNTLVVVEDQLRLAPDNTSALMDKGVLLLQSGEFSNAIPPFTRMLSLTNSYSAWLNRALAYLQLNQCDAAETDYRKMLRLFPGAYQPYYGLAEVALRRGNTNAAIQQYQQYLSMAPTNQDEFQTVMARLKMVQPQTP